MNESSLGTNSLVLKQADGIIAIEPQVLNGDLPASQLYNYLSQAEEWQPDEHIAAWEQHNLPWILGSYLDSLQRSPQIPVAFNYSVTSSSAKPETHHGQPPDRESRLIAAETIQMPAINANQHKVPKSSLARPGKRKAANRHPAQIDTVAAYTLSTGEVIREYQKSRWSHFIDFPPITQHLSEDIGNEDIIKHWPNHLWGPLLLKIAEKWKPQEISHMTPVDLKANAISKRLAAARIQGGEELPKTKRRKRKPFSIKGEPFDKHQVVSQPVTELKDSQAFRMNSAREIEIEGGRYGDRPQKRRKSDG